MEQATTLVDIRITWAFQNDCYGLRTISQPIRLIPACSSCLGMCDREACPFCGLYVCSFCNCNCQDAYYHQHQSETQSNSEEIATDNECEGESQIKKIAAFCETIPGSPLYAALEDLWAPRGTPMARLKDNMWVSVCCDTELCPPWMHDGRLRTFGEEFSDWSLLCDALAWEYPRGAAIINLDKKATVIFTPNAKPQTAHLNSALSWLRLLKEEVFGIAIRGGPLRMQGAVVEVNFEPRINRNASNKGRKIIVKAMSQIAKRS